MMAKKDFPSDASLTPGLRWLADPKKFPLTPICVVFGDEAFLRRSVLLRLGRVWPDAELSVLEGSSAEWKRAEEELSTFSMFGPSQRLILVNDADDFVSRFKTELEKYADAPAETGTLVLEMKTFASNTRLYKILAGSALLVDCKAPSAPELNKWVLSRAKNEYRLDVVPEAAILLVEQIGGEMGLLDQELAKLALVVEKGTKVLPETIRKHCGAWRVQTVWALLDSALEGRTAEALLFLGQLLDAGEAPIAILAQISSNLRRLAAATRIILSAEKEGRRVDVAAALSEAGVNRYVIQKTQTHLRRLGRVRGENLLQWIVDLDFDLKGDSPLPERLLLERFILRLSAPRALPPK
ncbi:MAG: DNA polymerase III subunit delta [Planctomycetia bacterium]|nr:DNA polymerase III subunit delta [Planctomycetia bacterium]